MTSREAIVRVAATTLFSVWSMGWLGASCGDRPGTPDMVHAEARDATDAEGRRIREIVLSWRNTARHGEQVWWDIEMKDGAGRVIPQRAGSGRPSSMYHERLFNAFLVGPRTTRCFRIKARTGAGTQGCVSQSWSAEVCATSRAPWMVFASTRSSGEIRRTTATCVVGGLARRLLQPARAGEGPRAGAIGSTDESLYVEHEHAIAHGCDRAGASAAERIAGQP